MPQSLTRVLIHIVFSTKDHIPTITPDVESDLYGFITAQCNSLHCRAYAVGGYLDHVHILCAVSQNIKISDLLRHLKVNSSKWMKAKFELVHFYWQAGYGTFSIHQSILNNVVQYIEKQHEHHKHISFKEEYRKLLRSNSVEFDERYVWD
jgi:putative transposase